MFMDENLEGKIAFLNIYKNEVEEKNFKDDNGNLLKGYIYTDRAVLAQHKILLRETLGRGSYSKVKEACDFNRYKQVAVKIIDCTKAPKDFQEKFLPRELDIWPRVNHPNVIRMYDYILNSDKIYMILEYANGGDMLTYIQKLNGPVPEKDCKTWMIQICSAVQYLHEKNIIHRDLKLENLLIDSNKNIKLCDFGFSKNLIDNSTIEELSKTYCGSKAYASPEILLGQPYDAKKADVWAVGVIFFIFLTGNMPFKEEKCNQMILNQQKSLRLYWIKKSKISAPAKNLIKWIFTFEWKKRPNIADISNNEYLSNKENNFLQENTDYNLRNRLLNNKPVKRIDKKKANILI